jgi:two-component system, cell cycle sensor histidine kinase and response regulator CckA
MSAESINVLLVEDDDLYAQILRGALGKSTPKVIVERRRTLADAAALVVTTRFDAVLLDLNLPDSSGLETIGRMLGAAPGIPIVVLTASAESDLALTAVQHGAQDYLVKSETDGKYLSRALRYAIERASFQTELIRREQQFRALIESAHDIVVLLGLDGSIRYQSPATERVLGYSPDELVGTSVLAIVHPDDRERAAGILSEWPQEELVPEPLAPFRVRHKDGSWRVMEAVGRSAEADPQQGMIVNARDITDRVRAQEKLLETEAKLRQAHKMEAVGRLAGGIAHDFNNVLTAIYGYADLLLEEFVAGDPRRNDVEEIRRMAERAATLTRQLLAFSRQQMLQPQVLDLNVVIDEVQRMLGRMIGTDIELLFEPSPDLWPVRADRGQIEQVLMNLGGNARDAMPEGGSLTIRTQNRVVAAAHSGAVDGLPAGSYVVMSVTDTGIGMPEHVRRHIFEPFFTTKAQGEGTGLGLATIYGIVKQSGGGISVESEENRGTTFSIYLPPHLS